jgi:hypothetical protein
MGNFNMDATQRQELVECRKVVSHCLASVWSADDLQAEYYSTLAILTDLKSTVDSYSDVDDVPPETMSQFRTINMAMLGVTELLLVATAEN